MYKYLVTVLKLTFQVSVLDWSISFCENFLLLLPTFVLHLLLTLENIYICLFKIQIL